MNIALSINKKFSKYAYVLVSSILENNSNVAFYILHNSLTEEIMGNLKEFVAKYDAKISFIDVGNTFADFPIMEKWPSEIYFRLLLPYVLPETEDRVLYLDTDIVDIAPLGKIYNLDFEDKSLAACQDVSSRRLSETQGKLFEIFNSADCALITSDINRRYFTGMKSSAGIVLAFPDKAYLLIDFRYLEKAQATVTDAEVIELKKLVPQITELLKKHDAKSMAIESETLTVKELNTYKHYFTDINIVDDDSLSNAITNLRMIKDDYEIECIQKAQDIAEKSLAQLMPYIKAGRTERHRLL